MLKENVKKKESALRLICFIFFSFTPTERMISMSDSIESFAKILVEIEKTYVEKIDYKKILNEVLEATLKKIDEDNAFLREDLEESGDRKELGIELEDLAGRFFVKKIKKNSDAFQKEIHVGTEILEIDGKKISSEEISLVEKKEGEITLTIAENDLNKKREVNIKKKKIEKGVIIGEKTKEKILYIKIESFLPGVANEVERLIYLNFDEIKGIIFDLRENGGGVLVECIKILEIFISSGREILKTVKNKGEVVSRYTTAREEAPIEGRKIVVLVDEKTASAAEVFAGVVQDLGLGIILGEKTYGKGTVQTIKEISEEEKIKITTARYTLPKGRQIKKGVGLVPDIIINKEKKTILLEEIKKKMASNRFFSWYASKKEKDERKNIVINNKVVNEFCSWIVKECDLYEERKVFKEIRGFLEKIPYNEQVNKFIMQIQQDCRNALIKELMKERSFIKKMLEEAKEEYSTSYEEFFMKKLNSDPVFRRAIELLKEEKDSKK